MEPEAQAVADAPILTALDRAEQCRGAAAGRHVGAIVSATLQAWQVVVAKLVNIAATEMSCQIEIAVAVDILEMRTRLAVLAGMHFIRTAERERLVVDAARVESRRGQYAELDLAIFVEVAAFVTELASGPPDVDVARPVNLQHAFRDGLSRQRQRIGRKDRESGQLNVLRCPPLIRELIEVVDERGIRCPHGGCGD